MFPLIQIITVSHDPGHPIRSSELENINISAKHLWDFISEILSLSLVCVKPGGRYLTHVSGKALPATRETFRNTVVEVSRNVGIEVNISFTEAFVPSFMESWVFAQITLVTHV